MNHSQMQLLVTCFIIAAVGDGHVTDWWTSGDHSLITNLSAACQEVAADFGLSGAVETTVTDLIDSAVKWGSIYGV